MGRKSNYTVNEKTVNPDQVKEKLHKNGITPEEIVAYLHKYGNFYEGKVLNNKTIGNYIRKICKENKALLGPKDFMDQSGNYVIEPNIQGLLLTLLDSPYFDGRIGKRLLKNKKTMDDILIENIEDYLSEEDKEIVKSDAAYMNALLESTLSNRLQNELVVLLRSLYHSHPRVRFRLMKDVIKALRSSHNQIISSNARIEADALVRGSLLQKEGEHHPLSAILKEKIRARSLEEVIMKCIAEKKHTKSQDQAVHMKRDNIKNPSLYVADQLDSLPLEDQDLRDFVTELDNFMEQTERFNEIKAKASAIFNEDDPVEKMIFEDIIRLTKLYLAGPALTIEDYAVVQRFIEEAIAKTNLDILNKFLND